MASHSPDKFKVASAFWGGLGKVGLMPVALLRQARLPASFCDGEKGFVTTAQFFALWRAIGELNPDPATGLKFAAQIDAGHYHPMIVAALHARDYRDALTRMARYKQLCSPEEMHLDEANGECVIRIDWLYAAGEEPPPLLTDLIFASFVEIARRGTHAPLNPKRVELKRPVEATRVHEAYFKCPVKFKTRRNALVFASTDLDRPFVTYNADLVEMLNPQLEKALAGRKARESIGEQVKGILKRQLAGNRPDIVDVAKEMGVSTRTLQRRITDEGASFRQLLLEARRELGRQYLARSSIDIKETAYLLGYDDPNSFHRAFRSWEGTTPAAWRLAQMTVSARLN